MVQVDVFWAYGIGAGFGIASAYEKTASPGMKGVWESPRFRDSMLFQSLVFVSSGFVLLWCFPSWETMHVGSRELPGWLVAAFAVTNMTQAILGFGLARWLAMTGRPYAGFLQWLLGYFLMFFILVHGWDGTGYIRFFSARPEWIPGWTPARVGEWFKSDVAITLAIMGIFVVPPVIGWMSKWPAEDRPGRIESPRWLRSTSVLLMLIVGMPGCAVVASVLVRYLGWIAGSGVFAALAWVALVRKGGLIHRYYRFLIEGEGIQGPVASLGKTAGQRA
jgi:hypothetical protein